MKNKHKFKEPFSFFTKSMTIALTTSLMISTVACQSKLDTQTSSSSNPSIKPTEIQTIMVAVIPWQNSQQQSEKLQLLADYLEQETGHKFDFEVAKDYQTAVDLLVDNKVQMAYLAASTYVEAKERNPELEPIVAPIDQETGRPWYTSVIVANMDQEIKSLQDLQGKRFGFVSPNSTSGYLLPIVQFQTMGFVPEKHFAKVHYSGSHNQAQLDLAAGIVDAIADDRPSFNRAQKSGPLKDAKYQVIWESDPIPNPPVVISKNLNPALINQLKKALINAPKGVVDVSGNESAGYTLVEDSDYDGIRKLKTQIQTRAESKQ